MRQLKQVLNSTRPQQVPPTKTKKQGEFNWIQRKLVTYTYNYQIYLSQAKIHAAFDLEERIQIKIFRSEEEVIFALPIANSISKLLDFFCGFSIDNPL